MKEVTARKWIMVLSLVVTCVVVGMLIVGFAHGKDVTKENKEKEEKYNEAVTLFLSVTEEKGTERPTSEDVRKVEQAIDILNEIPDYDDANAKLPEMQTELTNMKTYLEAEERMEDDVLYAAQMFHRLIPYRNASDREEEIYESLLKEANRQFDAPNYEEARALASVVPEYSESYSEAEELIQTTKTAMEEERRAARLDDAVACYKAGDPDKAQQILIDLGAYEKAEKYLNKIGKKLLASAKESLNKKEYISCWNILLKIDESREYPEAYEEAATLKNTVSKEYQDVIRAEALRLKEEKGISEVKTYLSKADSRILSGGWVSNLWNEMRQIVVEPVWHSEATNVDVKYLEYNGTLVEEDQIDSFFFTAENSGQARVFVKGMSEEAAVNLGVYDDMGYELAYKGWIESQEGGVTVELDSGKTYEVRVMQRLETTKYTLTVCQPKPPRDITGVTKVHDSVDYWDQTNTYYYTAQTDAADIGRYRFELSGMDAADDMAVTLIIYNELNEELGKVRSASNGDGITIQPIKAGETVKIEVLQDNNYTNYQLNVWPQKAFVPVTRECIVSDNFEYVDQKNVYTLTGVSGEVTVTLSEMVNGSEAHLLVFDELEDRVAAEEYCRNASVTFTAEAQKVYRIQVRQAAGSSSYRLSVD